jgi:hypothetical protein
MFGSSESVNTEVFKCGGCSGDTYRLFDNTPVGQQAAMVVVFQCVNGACRQHEQRSVIPSFTDPNVESPPMPVVPGRPENQLGCERFGMQQRRSAQNPHGFCLAEFFRVLERGNELYSRCTTCGHGAPIGMINAATG